MKRVVLQHFTDHSDPSNPSVKYGVYDLNAELIAVFDKKRDAHKFITEHFKKYHDHLDPKIKYGNCEACIALEKAK